MRMRDSEAETDCGTEMLSAIEECFERGWTDGLPVVPPVPALVRQFLAHTDRSASEVIWHMEQVRRGCTVEAAAINAAMAGCRPEYFPLVIAALEAAIHEGWPGNGGWQSTTGGGPLLVVNGPIRARLAVNSAGNVLGPGFRANATIGRAIRLIIMNTFGIRPHELDQSTQGNSGKFSLCIGENEEASPWEPLHVELGFGAEDDVVAAVHVRGCEFVENRRSGDAGGLLADLSDTISRTGSIIGRYKRAVVILSPEHAQLLADCGYSKRAVKEHLAAHSGCTAQELIDSGKDWIAYEDGEDIDGDHFIDVLPSPDDVLIVVAGAANAGVSAVGQTLGMPARFPGRAAVMARSLGPAMVP